jgi:predicted ATPase
MIEALRLRNLKSFRNTAEIPIRPITVLAGPNSAGKSSVLQSLLLLKQTLESEVSDAPLALDGRFLQVSQFNELTFQKPRPSSAEIEYQVKLGGVISADDMSPYFLEWPSYPTRPWASFQCTLAWTYRAVRASRETLRVVVNSFDEELQAFGLRGSFRARWMPRVKRYSGKLEGLELLPESRGQLMAGVGFRHFLPDHILLQPRGSSHRREGLTVAPLPVPLAQPVADLRTLLQRQLHYLGPLREEPRRAYLHLGTSQPEIGQRGESAAQVLWLERNDVVQYRPSPESGVEEARLLDAVNDAFRRLGIAQPITVRSDRSITYQLLFNLAGRQDEQVTIADVGFGVSQLLPVVVLTLRSHTPALLLFEQPEIHLHPRLQANLADFFIAASSSEKRIIIETHSDHFINRLRRRIAEDPTDELSERIAILFVRAFEEEAGIEPLEVDRYGVIKNWPPDFLPESADEAEAIFRAGLEKRKG